MAIINSFDSVALSMLCMGHVTDSRRHHCEAYGTLWIFIVVMVSTPGPANLLIMAAGAQQGFWPCVPFNTVKPIVGKLLLNLAMALLNSVGAAAPNGGQGFCIGEFGV